MSTGNHFIDRLFTPQRIFVIQRQEGDIGAGQHLLIDLASLFLAAPQARAVVIIKNDLPAVSAAFAQQRQQLVAAGRAEDGQADSAEIEIVKGGQLFANCGCLLALQPEFCRRLVTPVIKGALAGIVGFDVVQPG